jgi:hypothetical protein
MLHVLGNVMRRQPPHPACSCLDHNAVVIGDAYRSSRTVVDVRMAIVSPTDDPIAHGDDARPIGVVAAEATLLANQLTRPVIQAAASVVITRDQDRIREPVPDGGRVPFSYGTVEQLCAGAELDSVVLVRPLKPTPGRTVV